MPETLRRSVTLLCAVVAAQCVALFVAPAAALADPVRAAQWYLTSLDIPTAHRTATGTGVTIAVIDSGVDATHPDLSTAIIPGFSTGIGGGDALADYSGHGTRVTGIAVARGHGDNQGVLGIAPGAVAVPVDPGGTNGAFVPEAIDWAVQHGATVICIASTGGPDERLQQAVERALGADVVIVAGAGNEPDRPIGSPALYPGVVAAVGVDKDGNRATFSTTGPEAVLAAPAVDILTTDRGGGYTRTQGTSMSTAIIAGVAALVRSRYPNLSATEVVHRMTATATDKGPPGRDNEYGYGIVNPVAALTADITPETAAAPRPEPWLTRDIRLIAWIIGGALALSLATILIIRRTTGKTAP